jgi:hypothetical protein
MEIAVLMVVIQSLDHKPQSAVAAVVHTMFGLMEEVVDLAAVALLVLVPLLELQEVQPQGKVIQEQLVDGLQA